MRLQAIQRAAERQSRVAEIIGSGALLLPGARTAARNADNEFAFRQNSDFYYLTAFNEPDAVLLLHRGESILFVPPKDRDAETWTGRRAGVEGARDIYGAKAAHPNTGLETELPKRLEDVDVLYYALGCDARLDRLVLELVTTHRRTRPRRGHGIVEIRDPALVLPAMRLIKDADELACMRSAAAATAAGHLRVLHQARPGMHEYELQALLESEFRARGATGPAYGTIVGAGENATILHYRAGDAVLRQGELVLVDAGAEMHLYAADVTRTFPVSDSFTPEQRALYDLVLEAEQQAIATVRPGASFELAHECAIRVLSGGLIQLGLLEGPVDRVVETQAYRRFYMHRTGHWLGLDVHDAGSYTADGQPRHLEPGMVLTVEPGLYVAADDTSVAPGFRGIGIRIEDDVLVTASGAEVLTAAIPKTVADIEALRAEALRAEALRAQVATST